MTQLDLGIRVPCRYCHGEHTVRRIGALSFADCAPRRLTFIAQVHDTPYDRPAPVRVVR